MFTKNSQNLNIVQNFGHVPNKSIIYRPGILKFTDQNFNISRSGKVARKSKLKILKNTKNWKTKY